MSVEVIANSNSQILLANTVTAFSNLCPNGASFRITAQGFPVPGAFGSMTFSPSAQFNIYAGANGSSADPLIQTVVIPAGQPIFLDTFVQMRANAKSAGGLNPNALFVSATSNANVNSALSTSNTANISVYVLAGSGQNAFIVMQTAIVGTNTP
jgi:hypothetical protein